MQYATPPNLRLRSGVSQVAGSSGCDVFPSGHSSRSWACIDLSASKVPLVDNKRLAFPFSISQGRETVRQKEDGHLSRTFGPQVWLSMALTQG